MHLSKDYKTTLEFSKKLARATDLKKGWRALDLFLGLGYSAGELLASGASQVVCFEVRPLTATMRDAHPVCAEVCGSGQASAA